VDLGQRLCRDGAAGDAALVSDDDAADSCRFKPAEPLHHAGKERHAGGVGEIVPVDNQRAIAVEEDGKFAGLITLKDILKLIGKSLETVYIRLSGLSDEDEFVKKRIDGMIENTIQKLLKFIKVNYVVIHVEEHKKKEVNDKRKYSVQGRFITDKGNFYASDHEWEPIKAMKLFLDHIETEIYKQNEKSRGY